MFDGLDPAVQAFLVSAEAWPKICDRAQPYLQKMADGSGGRYLREDIENEIRQGNFQLWVALDGPDIVCALLTQVMHYPRFRAMRLIAIVGHRPLRWMRLLPQIEASAKRWFGCDRMEALHQARHGILLRTPGWREFHVLSEKDL